MNDATRFDEAVQYSYYSKVLTEPAFNTIVSELDPTPNHTYGRWVVETFIKTFLKPIAKEYAENPSGTFENLEAPIEETYQRGLKLFSDEIVSRGADRFVILTMEIPRFKKVCPDISGNLCLFANESHYSIRASLSKFDKVKHKLTGNSKNIMSYPSFLALSNEMSSDEVEEIIHNLEMSKVSPDEYEVIYRDPTWFILKPLTERASIKYGWGTQWCTAGRSNNRFYYYTGGDLIIFMKKEGSEVEKWQIYLNDPKDSTHQEWKDAEDAELSERSTLTEQLPEEARNKLFLLTKSSNFLSKEHYHDLCMSLLKSENNKVLASFCYDMSKENFVRTVDDYWPNRVRYLSDILPKSLIKKGFDRSYNFDGDDDYAYSLGYDHPWDYLEDQDPELADEAEKCPACGGEGYGLYYWDPATQSYTSTLTETQFDSWLQKCASAEKQNTFKNLYKKVGNSYHVKDKGEFISVLSSPGTAIKCLTCDGSGMAGGRTWKHEVELWSEDQRSEAGSIASDQALDYAKDEIFRDLDYQWDRDLKNEAENVYTEICNLLPSMVDVNDISEDDKIETLQTLFIMAPLVGVEIPVPTEFLRDSNPPASQPEQT